MSSKYIIIVGGNSEAGRSALEAVRDIGEAVKVLGTTSGEKDIDGYDHTIPGIDLNDALAAEKVRDAVLSYAGGNLAPDTVQALVFTPAFGPIGYPIPVAPIEDARAALAFSYTPMMRMADLLHPQLSIGYSAFFWLAHTRVGYGAMAYAKLALDYTAFREPERFRAIRGGTFRSPATRGIGLLLQRAMKKTPHQGLIDLGERYKEKGGKFSDFFFDYAFAQENAAFGERFETPHRPTTRDDLKAAAKKILTGETKAPVVSVIGDWMWDEHEMPEIGEGFTIKDQVLKELGFD